MLTGNIEYGTWKDGSSVYKDKVGFYIVDINEKDENYKKYLKNWKPVGDNLLYLDKTKGIWTTKKPTANKTNKNSKNTSKKTSKKTSKNTSKNTSKKNTTKYANRPSPRYPANDYCGKNKRGNDKNMYTSKKNKNGVCRWVKIE